MKKKLSLILLVVLAISILGCGTDDSESSSKKDNYAGSYSCDAGGVSQTMALKKDGTFTLLINDGKYSDSSTGTWEDIGDGKIKLNIESNLYKFDYTLSFIDDDSFEVSHKAGFDTIPGFGGIFKK